MKTAGTECDWVSTAVRQRRRRLLWYDDWQVTGSPYFWHREFLTTLLPWQAEA